VALGGILGSLLRWSLSQLFDGSRNGTLAANLIGVALASFFLVAMERHGKSWMRHFLLPGFCGGLTTFSAVAFQSVEGDCGFIYLILTLIFSIAIAAISIPIARKSMAVN